MCGSTEREREKERRKERERERERERTEASVEWCISLRGRINPERANLPVWEAVWQEKNK